MSDIILGSIVVFLALTGVVSCIRFLLFRLYKSKNDKTIMLITPAAGVCEDIEYTLRSCAAKIKWMGKVRPYRVICLDTGMDQTTRKICKKICSEYEFMELASKEKLNSILEANEVKYM
ncbi:MAG: hypothetical protein E7563_07700 [Ruminococcaceae bacterium]|nr:hypothetical protein [Oscillospiraceae bacterium]